MFCAPELQVIERHYIISKVRYITVITCTLSVHLPWEIHEWILRVRLRLLTSILTIFPDGRYLAIYTIFQC